MEYESYASLSPGLAALDAEHIKLAEHKLKPHACCASAVADPARLSPWSPSDDVYREATDRLKAGKCMDVSGWSHKTWIMISRSDVVGPLLRRSLRVVSALALGHPVRQIYSAHCLVLLKKKDGGARPLLIGTVLRKVCHAAVYLVTKQDLFPVVASHQYGIGAAIGASMMAARLHFSPEDRGWTTAGHELRKA